MKNTEMAKAFKLFAEGFTILAQCTETLCEIQGDVQPVKNTKSEIVEKDNTPVNEPPKKDLKPIAPKKDATPPKDTNAEEVFSKEELTKMGYNDIKALAKKLGVKAIGSKQTIIDAIISLNGVPEEEEEIEKTPEKSPQKINKISKKVEEPEEIEEPEEEEEIEEEEESTLYDTVALALEEYEDEDLATILSDIGVSPKGKRQALLAKIVQAIEEGKLEWDTEETEEETVDNTEKPSQEIQEDEDEEDDFVGSETRRRTCINLVDDTLKAIQDGDISHKEILKYLKKFDEKYVSLGEEEDAQEYVAILCDLVDDEGTLHELEEPYFVGDDIYCCAQPLVEVDGDLYCEICGTTYQA